MLVKQEFLDKIKQNLNINIYEAKVWTALLSRGVATASQLADISGVPRSRCYDVLETLEKEGFIITKLGKPIKYIAVQPEEVIKRQKKVINQEAEHKIEFIDAIKGTEVFRELGLLHKTGIEKVSIEDITAAIKGRNELNRQVKDMIKKAKKSVTIATTKQSLPKYLKLLKKINNSVKIELCAPIDTSKITVTNGIKVKRVDVSTRFVSVDNKQALFMITDENVDPDYDTGILVKSEFFTKAMDNLIKANMR